MILLVLGFWFWFLGRVGTMILLIYVFLCNHPHHIELLEHLQGGENRLVYCILDNAAPRQEAQGHQGAVRLQQVMRQWGSLGKFSRGFPSSWAIPVSAAPTAPTTIAPTIPATPAAAAAAASTTRTPRNTPSIRKETKPSVWSTRSATRIWERKKNREWRTENEGEWRRMKENEERRVKN